MTDMLDEATADLRHKEQVWQDATDTANRIQAEGDEIAIRLKKIADSGVPMKANDMQDLTNALTARQLARDAVRAAWQSLTAARSEHARLTLEWSALAIWSFQEKWKNARG